MEDDLNHPHAGWNIAEIDAYLRPHCEYSQREVEERERRRRRLAENAQVGICALLVVASCALVTAFFMLLGHIFH